MTTETTLPENDGTPFQRHFQSVMWRQRACACVSQVLAETEFLGERMPTEDAGMIKAWAMGAPGSDRNSNYSLSKRYPGEGVSLRLHTDDNPQEIIHLSLDEEGGCYIFIQLANSAFERHPKAARAIGAFIADILVGEPEEEVFYSEPKITRAALEPFVGPML